MKRQDVLTKWNLIKLVVAKFVGVYNSIFVLNQKGKFLEDILQKALDLFTVKHPKTNSFLFIHYWLVLKDVPKWSYLKDLESEINFAPMKRKAPSYHHL